MTRQSLIVLTLSVAVAGTSALAGPPQAERTLSFDERVAATVVLERYQYAHQVGATLPFEHAVPESLLKERIRRTAVQSWLLETRYHTPVTAAMLEAEMRRVAANTQLPERLTEIFAALGNDPVLVQEILIRPSLTERLLRSFVAGDTGLQGERREEIERLREAVQGGALDPRTSPARCGVAPGGESVGSVGEIVETDDSFSFDVRGGSAADTKVVAECSVPKLAWRDLPAPMTADLATVADGSAPLPLPAGTPARPGGTASCAPANQWVSGSLSENAPPIGTYSARAFWTGTEVLYWGGKDSTDQEVNRGARYNPLTDSWATMSTVNGPGKRDFYSAVWSGSELLVWGGSSTAGHLNTGARYNPSTDSWTAITTTGAPYPRTVHGAVWTGSEMMVWGGTAPADPLGQNTLTGGRYNPATDSWTATSTVGAPSSRNSEAMLLVGGVVVIWGGKDSASPFPVLGTGARYTLATDTWSPTSGANAPSARIPSVSVSTGTLAIVWGASGTATGGMYDPAADSWTLMNTSGAPAGLTNTAAVWTGSQMIVWAGSPATGPTVNTGARFNPASNTWSTMTATGAPTARSRHSAVWTGSAMVAWGGTTSTLNGADTGGRYNPASDSWTPTKTTGNPAPRNGSTVWTGTEMILWGGTNVLGGPDTGFRYNPLLDTWTATATTGAPSGRSGHAAVWTGSEMIIFGGVVASSSRHENDGGRYNPMTDSWLPVPNAGTKVFTDFTGSYNEPAVHWTGTKLLVWGGWAYHTSFDAYGKQGALYDPPTNAWTSIATFPFTLRRSYSTAWTGTQMIVWGGSNIKCFTGCQGSYITDGAIYDLASDKWSRFTGSGNPADREGHTAIWTGNRMLVWGGVNGAGTPPPQSYDPVSNTWAPISTTGAPPATGGQFFPMSQWSGKWWMLSSPPTTPFAAALYEPVANAWQPVSTLNAPTSNVTKTPLLWTGSEMIFWVNGRGGRYLITAPGTDSDGDGASDACDLCPGLANLNQTDFDLDGIGDACDPDADGDGVSDITDNCLLLANAPQTNTDGDARGNACDNCPNLASADFWDFDGDGLGNPCDQDDDADSAPDFSDNCPLFANPSQVDGDSDGTGDECDACPTDPLNDTDGDGRCASSDNCPTIANPSQTNSDGDSFGDVCDNCPTITNSNQADADADTKGDVCDNCISTFNLAQQNSDGDTFGDLCDNCPSTSNQPQSDTDGDGAGDLCDCQASDPLDRSPAETIPVTATRAGTTIMLNWPAIPGADLYSIARGQMPPVQAGDYGVCVSNAVLSPTYQDSTLPPAGSAFFYQIVAQNLDCGMGSPGRTSSELPRVNTVGTDCAERAKADAHASAETLVFGTASGSFAQTLTSNDSTETLTEKLNNVNPPSSRWSGLEHRWTISIPAGIQIQLHVEGFRSNSTDGDDFRFEYSTNGGGSWTAVGLASLPFADANSDLSAVIPAGPSGTLLLRVVDTNHTPGTQTLDSVSIDELFLRSVQ